MIATTALLSPSCAGMCVRASVDFYCPILNHRIRTRVDFRFVNKISNWRSFYRNFLGPCDPSSSSANQGRRRVRASGVRSIQTGMEGYVFMNTTGDRTRELISVWIPRNTAWDCVPAGHLCFERWAIKQIEFWLVKIDTLPSMCVHAIWMGCC